jgi:hypothetical protein
MRTKFTTGPTPDRCSRCRKRYRIAFGIFGFGDFPERRVMVRRCDPCRVTIVPWAEVLRAFPELPRNSTYDPRTREIVVPEEA